MKQLFLAILFLPSILFSQDFFLITQNAQNSTCNNGSMQINFTSGITNATPPFEYEWSNGATTNTINNLKENLYSVTITDALCNMAYLHNYVFCTNCNYQEIQFNYKVNSICGELGRVNVEIPSDANFDYDYKLLMYNDESNEYEEKESQFSTGGALFDNLAVGLYAVEVNIGICYETIEFEIILEHEFSLSQPILYNPSSRESFDGMIDFKQEGAKGGIGIINGTWKDNDGNSIPNHPLYGWGRITNLSNGTYILTLSDEANCIEQFYFNIASYDAIKPK